MKIEYQKKFLKELAEIPSSRRKEIEDFVFNKLPTFQTIAESGKIERMKDYPGYYKIRFGDYRVGLKFERGTIILERVLNRKEIYRHFP